jgi:poly-gamma-glutamate capsule biosynthesis protein CapA/YwtB (metallophosphatase superfamily)
MWLVPLVAVLTLAATYELVTIRPAGARQGGPASSLGEPRAPATGNSPASTGAPSAPAASKPPAVVTITWVGDMTFGSPDDYPADGAASLISDVTPDLRGDVVAGNLETAIGDLPMSKCAPKQSDCYEFEAPDDTARALRQDGFSAVNVANNHTLDAGTAGQASTDAALRSAGLAWAGRPGQITYLTRNGVTIALLGFAPWPYDADLLDIPAAESLVRQARQHAQLVIVMEHAGAEGDDARHVRPGEEYYLGEDRGNSTAFAHGVIDAGADLVMGSGPHVLRGFQWYHGHLIAYSLGNFCGYDTLALDSVTSVSAILHVTLSADGQFAGGSISPIRLAGSGTPQPDPSGAAITVINTLSRDDFAASGAARITAAGHIQPPPPGQ